MTTSLTCLAEKQTPREKLISRLAKIQKKGYMYGHQDDTFYGVTWNWDNDRSDTYDLVGDYPGVMGFDLGGIEKGDKKNLDSVPFSRIREAIILQHERGGIVTLSWHPRNPLIGSTSWIQNDTVNYNEAVTALKKIGQQELVKQIPNPKHTVRAVLPGGCKHELFMKWLKRVSEFLLSLKDKNGNQIPLIFRPWHENNGSWFWWGQENCSDQEYHALWNLTQDYINSTKIGCIAKAKEPCKQSCKKATGGSSKKSSAKKNTMMTTLGDCLVWSYSPNLHGTWTEEAWLVRYPGDERVDLIGEDAYQWGTEQDFISGLDADLQVVTKIALEHGKLFAVTECGYKNSPDTTWWQRVFKPIIEKYTISYFLPWRNYSKEHFGASPDASTADDFKTWAKQKNFLFVNDIKKIK